MQSDAFGSSPADALPRKVVCHLIASNFLGGPEKQILEHCRRLDGSRWHGVIGSFRENRDAVELTDAAGSLGLPVFLIDTRSPFSPLAVRQLRSFLRTHGVAVLVTHGYKANLVGYLASRGTDIYQIPFFRGYTAEDTKIRIYEILDRWILKRFPRVLCVSHRSKKTLAGYGLNPGRIQVVHNAVTVQKPTVSNQKLREATAIPPGRPVMVAVGRLSIEKGQRFLVDALVDSRLTELAPHLVLIGEGRERDRLQAQAKRLGVSDRVHLVGFRRDAHAWIAESDLLVNASLTEGLPNVVLEAHAVATPVVATRVGGVGELVNPGDTGWLVPPGDPAALAGAIHEALADPALAENMARNARQLVVDSFSFETQARTLTEVYDRSVPGIPGRDRRPVVQT